MNRHKPKIAAAAIVTTLIVIAVLSMFQYQNAQTNPSPSPTPTPTPSSSPFPSTSPSFSPSPSPGTSPSPQPTPPAPSPSPPPNTLFYTSFEGTSGLDSDIGPGNYGGWIEESTTIVHTGTRARHIYALKTWQWTADTLVDVIEPYPSFRAIPDPSNPTFCLRVRLGDVMPSMVGTWHFTGGEDSSAYNIVDAAPIYQSGDYAGFRYLNFNRDALTYSGGVYGFNQTNPRARLTKSVTNQYTDLYARAYIYVHKLDDGWFEFSEYYCYGQYPNGHFAHLYIRYFGIDVELNHRGGTDGVSSGIILTANTWYCLEWRFLWATNGGVQVWLNGNMIIDFLGYDTTVINWNALSIQWGENISHIYGDDQNDGMDIYVDDLVIANHYIGV